ncbi:hypothetical protein [Muricauda sp. MAR_2010_75]|uniref:hypothetical protein n=1 Tax=Allomuricauda sp. MAR_2010_75 TaxID=1250232 RepID=UPI00055CAD46|nr:hypothetical protein [Muricauda sp. MAR_2010_75]
MAIITETIPKQAFEVVGEQIGAILTIELVNQKTLHGLTENMDVYHERTTPYDKSEGVMVNVLLDNATYEGFNPSSSNGPVRFNVDVYGTAKSNQDDKGDKLSQKLVQKIIGWIRYILSHTKHKTLLLPSTTIGGTYVTGFQVYDLENVQDAAYVRMMRLNFEVKVVENQDLWESTQLLGNDTQVKLEETDKGFKYILEND